MSRRRHPRGGDGISRGSTLGIGSRIAGIIALMLATIALLTGTTIWALTTIVDNANDTTAEVENEAVPLLRVSHDTNLVARYLARLVIPGAGDSSVERLLERNISEIDRMLERLESIQLETDVGDEGLDEEAAFERGVRRWATARAQIIDLLDGEIQPFDARVFEIQAQLERTSNAFQDAHAVSLVELREASVAVDAERERAFVATFVVAGAAVLMGALISWRLRVLLVKPIRGLREATTRLAAGDLEQPVEPRGPRELADLANTLNGMAGALRHRELELVYRALHDPLTGLGNRALFHERVRQALARLHRRKKGALAVLLVDIDGFKKVNDTIGHPAGDDTLKKTAARISSCLREDDTLSRLGGDEFVVVAEDVNEGADSLAQRICDAVKQPLEVDGRLVTLTASAGIAVAETGDESADELLADADLAMYEAKKAGGDGHRRFTRTFRELAIDRFELETDLRLALERGELEPHYQPIVDMRGGSVHGVEALVRWHHPTRGLLLPDAFLPIAQEAGLLADVSWSVLRSALSDLHSWLDHDAPDTFDLAVNIARAQFAQSDFVERFMAELEHALVAPERVIVEITETEMLRSADSVRPKLVELRRLGVRVALDDFGTGFTSLNYLANYPVDILKIDRSFVSGLQYRDDHAKLVRTIIELATAFDLETIAEGVEEQPEADALLELGSTVAQGFAFYRPAPAGAITKLLRERTGSAEVASTVPGS